MHRRNDFSLAFLQFLHLFLPPRDGGVMRRENSDDILIEQIAIASKDELALVLGFLATKDFDERLAFKAGFF